MIRGALRAGLRRARQAVHITVLALRAVGLASISSEAKPEGRDQVPSLLIPEAGWEAEEQAEIGCYARGLRILMVVVALLIILSMLLQMTQWFGLRWWPERITPPDWWRFEEHATKPHPLTGPEREGFPRTGHPHATESSYSEGTIGRPMRVFRASAPGHCVGHSGSRSAVRSETPGSMAWMAGAFRERQLQEGIGSSDDGLAHAGRVAL